MGLWGCEISFLGSQQANIIFPFARMGEVGEGWTTLLACGLNSISFRFAPPLGGPGRAVEFVHILVLFRAVTQTWSTSVDWLCLVSCGRNIENFRWYSPFATLCREARRATVPSVAGCPGKLPGYSHITICEFRQFIAIVMSVTSNAAFVPCQPLADGNSVISPQA